MLERMGVEHVNNESSQLASDVCVGPQMLGPRSMSVQNLQFCFSRSIRPIMSSSSLASLYSTRLIMLPAHSSIPCLLFRGISCCRSFPRRRAAGPRCGGSGGSGGRGRGRGGPGVVAFTKLQPLQRSIPKRFALAVVAVHRLVDLLPTAQR